MYSVLVPAIKYLLTIIGIAVALLFGVHLVHAVDQECLQTDSTGYECLVVDESVVGSPVNPKVRHDFQKDMIAVDWFNPRWNPPRDGFNVYCSKNGGDMELVGEVPGDIKYFAYPDHVEGGATYRCEVETVRDGEMSDRVRTDPWTALDRGRLQSIGGAAYAINNFLTSVPCRVGYRVKAAPSLAGLGITHYDTVGGILGNRFHNTNVVYQVVDKEARGDQLWCQVASDSVAAWVHADDLMTAETLTNFNLPIDGSLVEIPAETPQTIQEMLERIQQLQALLAQLQSGTKSTDILTDVVTQPVELPGSCGSVGRTFTSAASTWTNVRAEASATARLVGELMPGQSATLFSTNTFTDNQYAWCGITLANGTTGWAVLRYLEPTS